ncbi:MAG: biotin/lipoyl-containing protein [Methanoregula sp.]|nr:biotin/lipoyl-containing protein [Methanoregula sp.]
MVWIVRKNGMNRELDVQPDLLRRKCEERGDTLLVLEVIKMQNPLHSPIEGNITGIFVNTGYTVQNGDMLMRMQ